MDRDRSRSEWFKLQLGNMCNPCVKFDDEVPDRRIIWEGRSNEENISPFYSYCL